MANSYFFKFVDQAARDTPDRLVGMVAKSSDISQGFHRITMRSLSRAINFTAPWIDGHLGRSPSMQTYAYVGVADFRYMVIELTAIKCGHQALVFSPRNAASHNIILFDSSNCHTLFYAIEMEALAKVLTDKVPGLKIIQVPTFEDMITSLTEDYPYRKTWEEVKDDTFLILHTSGSTESTETPLIYQRILCCFG